MLSVRISSCRVRSVHASVSDAHAQCTHQFLPRMLSMCWRDLFKFGIFTLMLSIRVRNWCICSGYASIPDPYAQHVLEGLRSVHTLVPWCVCSMHATVPDSYAQCTHQFLTHMLSGRINFWRACSVHAIAPYVHAEGEQNKHLKKRKTDAHGEHARKELICMVRVHISSWPVCSACA